MGKASNEARLRASDKYRRANMYHLSFNINKKTEPELYEWMQAKENKMGYLKELIYADMKKKG